MSYTYDDQLIDAVSVRRQRLTGALMFGRARLRREWNDRLRGRLRGHRLRPAVAR